MFVFCVSRGDTPMFGSSTLQGVCSLSFSLSFQCFFAIQSLPYISILLRCPVLPSLLLFCFYCRSLPLQPASFSCSAVSFWPRSPYVCVSVSWLFAFALSPLLLALFCCLRSSVSDIGFLAFASTQTLRRGPLVVVAIVGFTPLGSEVLRFDYRVSFPAASLSFQCPYPASQLLPLFLHGIRSEYCVGVSSRDRGSSPVSSFRGCLLLLIWLWLPFSSYLSSSFCHALLLFFPCSFTTFLGFSALFLGRSLTSSVTLRFSFLLMVVSGRHT